MPDGLNFGCEVCAVRVVARFRPPVSEEERREELLAPVAEMLLAVFLPALSFSLQGSPAFTVDAQGVGISAISLQDWFVSDGRAASSCQVVESADHLCGACLFGAWYRIGERVHGAAFLVEGISIPDSLLSTTDLLSCYRRCAS